MWTLACNEQIQKLVQPLSLRSKRIPGNLFNFQSGKSIQTAWMKRGTARQLHSAWASRTSWTVQFYQNRTRAMCVHVHVVSSVFMSIEYSIWNTIRTRNVYAKYDKNAKSIIKRIFIAEFSLQIRHEKCLCENIKSVFFYSFVGFLNVSIWLRRQSNDSQALSSNSIVFLYFAHSIFGIGTSADCDICFPVGPA